ncbi:MAG TPA: DVUA0089 family protein [Candidatus Sulfopaludibacter sp.]|nr:DVUA0089 family protein [Candidatus Sulfopaludibacter sp.]
MNHRFLLLPVLVASLQASTISYTGSLNPSDANDVFLTTFSISTTSDVSFQSWGYAGGINGHGQVIPSGGFDSYLTVFTGFGPTATFLASNDDGCLGCADPSLSLPGLAAGTYTVALTAFDNFSFAEMFPGFYALGDGFIGLGDYYDSASDSIRTSDYALDVTSSAGFASTPEPGTFLLLAAGAALIFTLRRKLA